MRVKLLLALAIASIVLLCAADVAFAADDLCGTTSAVPETVTGISTDDLCGTTSAVPGTVTGIPTAEELTAAANEEIAAFGFPDLSTVDTAVAVPADTIDATTLDSPICGVCGECPPCSCEEKLTVFQGPKVNLGCPLVITKAVPVNLVSPVIAPVFPVIDVAPQAVVNVPQVNAKLNCFDIECQPCTDINVCPTVTPTPRPTAKPRPVKDP